MLNFRPRIQPFTAEEFKNIYGQVPRLTVEILLKTNQGIVLIQRQESSWHGQWHVPGGTVFYREKIVDTIRRVGFEELGIAIRPVKLISAVEYWDEISERGFGFSVGLAHICEPIEEITPEVLAEWEKRNIRVFTQPPADTIREQLPMIEAALKTN